MCSILRNNDKIISIAFIPTNGNNAPPIPYINIFLMKVFCGDSSLDLTPLSDNGINAGMIIALNIRVESKFEDKMELSKHIDRIHLGSGLLEGDLRKWRR